MRGLLVFVALAFAASACNVHYVRPVKKTGTGGEFALHNPDSEEARAAASKYMSQQCPKGYGVLEEGEVVVGTQTSTTSHGNQGQNRSGFTFGTKSYSERSTTSTTEQREWRVKFQCTDGTAPPAEEKAAPTQPSNEGSQSRVQTYSVRF